MPKNRVKNNFVRAQLKLQGATPIKQGFRMAAFRLVANKRLENQFNINKEIFNAGRFNQRLTK